MFGFVKAKEETKLNEGQIEQLECVFRFCLTVLVISIWGGKMIRAADC